MRHPVSTGPFVPRSRWLLVLALLLGLATAARPAIAQDATPGATQAVLAAYPELRIRATDEGLTEPPTRVDAGRYLVVLENAGTHDHALYLVQPPADLTVADLLAATEATPGPGTPEPQGPPDWFFRLTFRGGPAHAAAGREARAIIDLGPGEYGLLDPIAAGAGEPNWLVPLAVAAGPQATPAAAPDPPADATIEMREFAFAGLPERVTPGLHVWEVTNAGEQPHELAVAKAPDGTTLEQLQASFVPPGGTPPPNALDPDALVSAGGMSSLSPGLVGWAVLDLEPGTYVAFDFFSASMGMVAVFTVEE